MEKDVLDLRHRLFKFEARHKLSKKDTETVTVAFDALDKLLRSVRRRNKKPSGV